MEDKEQLATGAKEGLHPQSDTQSRTSFAQKSKHSFTRLANFNPFKSSYWALYNQLDDFRSKCILALGIICAIAAGVPLPIIAIIFRTVVDTFPPPEASLDTAIYEIIGIACAYFVITWTWSICWGVVGEKIARGFREALVEKAMGMEMSYFDVKAPDMTITLTGDTQTIQRGTSEKVGLFIQSISYFIATFIVGFILSAELTGILLVAVVPAMIIIVSVGSHITSKWSKEASRLVSEAAAVAEGAIGAVRVVQAFGANNVISDEYIRILKIATRAAFRRSTAGALMLGLIYFTAYSINALAFWEGSRLSTGSGAGTIYAVVFLILDASFVVNQFGPFIQTFAVAAAAGSKITAVLKDTSHIDVYSNEGVIAEPATFDHDIVFSEVCFAYPARPSIQVLQSASFTLEPGTTTGIVGLSGSGKSTIASLLERLYDPESGSLAIGGRNFKDYNITSLRNQMALVDQTPVLFRGTILDNIRHGVSSVDNLSDQEVLNRCSAAAKKANADFIWSLPNGIHTWIGGSGQSELSGGQMQRVCLARALVREPKMLILDEPTSALDATSELKILTALKDIAASGCTIVMVAHRLATIRHAHNILVMGDGKILEQGKHDHLVKTDGPYKSLVEAQGMRTSQAGSNEPISEPPEVASSEDSKPSETQLTKDVDIEKTERAEEPNQHQNRDTFTLIQRCLRLSRSKSWLIILGLCAAIISGALIVGEAIVFGHLVAILNTESGSSGFRSTVNFLCLMFFVISLVALLAFSTSGTAFGIVSEHLLLKIRSISLKTILVQDMAWFEDPDHSTHKLMASINTDSGSLSGISGVVIGTIFQVSTNIVCGIVVAHVVAWEIAVVLLSTVPAVVLAGFLRVRILTKFDEKHASDYLEAAALASEACENIRTVAAFGREADVLQQYRDAVERPYRKSFKFNILGNLMLAFSYSLIYFVYALAFWWGSQRVRAGQYTQEDFFILLPALLLSAQSSGQFFSLAPEITQARSAARRVFELHDQRSSIMVTEEVDRSTGTKDVLQEKRILQGSDGGFSRRVQSEKMESQLNGSKVVLDSVEMRYPSRPDVSAVQDISLSIGAGQFIGVVGPSGAGKSTVVSLLERFYDPTSGSVFVDDTDIREIPVRQYRAGLSLVSQEPGLFAGSVSFNVGLGARPGDEATQNQIEDVCKQCGVHDFVISLPEGYNTECGRGGSKLSGGQKQRIAVARALLRNPRILLLDEATSALDSHSEKKVQEAIAAASSGRTTIVVAHRLSSVLRADRIFVFDNGSIAEDGTHDELYAKGGVYTQMAQAQGLRQGVASDR